ncbi:hypothetical protein ACFFLS_09915 [Flavobacterium procerum]|uniref:Lipoprotein n=1 Tax=Flavobacterium procerum TaxID=1455569 RepID=A0ABV6BPI0_9FLAO
MKLLKTIGLVFLFVFSISSCKNNDQPKATKETPKAVIKDKMVVAEDTIVNDYPTAPVDFLEEKYKKNGFVLPDGLGPSPTIPGYTFFDKNLGGFSICYIGKSKLIQDYWSVSNSEGFFGQFENIDQAMYDLKDISNKVSQVLKNKPNDYYIIADFLPKEAIAKYYNDESGEFDLKDNACTYFYIYENNKWVFIKKLLTNTITDPGLSLYNDLLLFHKSKKEKLISDKSNLR